MVRLFTLEIAAADKTDDFTSFVLNQCGTDFNWLFDYGCFIWIIWIWNFLRFITTIVRVLLCCYLHLFINLFINGRINLITILAKVPVSKSLVFRHQFIVFFQVF